MPEPECHKRDASEKNGRPPSCKCIFDRIEVNLAEIKAEIGQNVQKTRFFPKKLQESMG